MNVRVFFLVLASIVLTICGVCPSSAVASDRSPESIEQARRRMVTDDVIGAGITNSRVIQTMSITPRHEFAPPKLFDKAYLDMSLPLGEHQTLTPPMLVAYMTDQLDPQPSDVVLEIGTGSGYQAAVLSPLVKEVYSIEIVEKLGKRAERTLKRLNYSNVFTKLGDGYLGWPEKAPFDKIIVTCSPEKVPRPLVDQLREGGRMIVPVGEPYQQVFHLLKKENGQLVSEALRPTLFVPMTGQAADRRQVKADPLHPALTNPSFEEVLPESGEPTGWYYVRQMKVVQADDAPHEKCYATFRNEEPGRSCRALQGFAIDGRKIRTLYVSCMVKASDVAVGIAPDQLPQFAIIFLNENRAPAGNVALGPWSGSFSWQNKTGKLKVPPSAREAIVNIGLIGGTGEVSYDDIQMTFSSSEK
ncbi:MAG TPA: protein-L-isoaspartate(D-aspartate) O-methyltransferase [Pirellulales bacterium]|jgi:protein-L-isoaspartate(D-aspartate) O-methyltransferase